MSFKAAAALLLLLNVGAGIVMILWALGTDATDFAPSAMERSNGVLWGETAHNNTVTAMPTLVGLLMVSNLAIAWSMRPGHGLSRRSGLLAMTTLALMIPALVAGSSFVFTSLGAPFDVTERVSGPEVGVLILWFTAVATGYLAARSAFENPALPKQA